MFSIFVFSSALVLASASSYGGSSGGGGDYGGHMGAVDAAVKSQHSVSTYPVANQQQVHNPVVDINSGPLPLTIQFNSHSSQINAIQKHFGHSGQVQKQNAVDEPDLLIQNIRKPVIQNIREVIQPFRTRTQEIRPVQEKIETVIASGNGGGFGGNGGGGNGNGGKYGGKSYEGY